MERISCQNGILVSSFYLPRDVFFFLVILYVSYYIYCFLLSLYISGKERHLWGVISKVLSNCLRIQESIWWIFDQREQTKWPYLVFFLLPTHHRKYHKTPSSTLYCVMLDGDGIPETELLGAPIAMSSTIGRATSVRIFDLPQAGWDDWAAVPPASPAAATLPIQQQY